MNLPTLKVMACPVNAGRHPYHDSRWIVTSDSEVEWNANETEWRLKEGSLICEMRDCQNQEHLARLFSSAPELLEVLETIARGSAKDVGPNGLGVVSFDYETAKEIARAAIRKARGEA